MAFHLRRQQRNLDLSELTPVSVRGKKRPHSQISSAASSRASTPQVSSPKASKHASSSTSKPATKRQRRIKTLSPLELLPAEIIANIFSYTCNINFPRASPSLASKLTGEHIYSQFCKRLFCSFELPALLPLFKRKSGVHRYRCYVGSLDEEKDLVRYREMAFTCKWMTLARFRLYRQAIIDEEKQCQEATFSPGSSMKAVCCGRFARSIQCTLTFLSVGKLKISSYGLERTSSYLQPCYYIPIRPIRYTKLVVLPF